MSSGSRTIKRRVRTSRSTGSPSYPRLSSAETVAEIDDILIRILSFLPIKALLRFKCVSKRWLTLIADPKFYRIISSKPPTISGLFLRRNFRGLKGIEYEILLLDDNGEADDDSTRFINRPFKLRLRFVNHPGDMIILQSCNGLMLCCCSCRKQHDKNYYVYNPTTKQNTHLPPINGLGAHVFGFCLAFDPSKSPHYKVICLRTSDPLSDLCQIEIYSSDTRLWMNSGSPLTLPSISDIQYTVFWNSAAYWLDYFGTCISFNIEQEKIQILPLPDFDADEEPDKGAISCLNESQGYLYFVQVNDLESSQFLVYEMERDGSGWSPKYNVSLEHLSAAFPDMIRTESYTNRRIFAFHIVCIIRQETFEDSYMILHIPNKVVRYNFKDKTFKKLGDFKLSAEHEDSEFLACWGSFQFLESLACF